MKRWRFPAWTSSSTYPRQRLVGGVAVAILLAGATALLPMGRHRSAPVASGMATTPAWIYGNPQARYTLIEYADLECPYCKAYFPVLKQWIDTHPDVNWQWHHRPLAIHEPAATREARLAECAGRTNGNAGFWHAVTWIYANTRGNGEGVPASATFPENSPRLMACIDGAAATHAVQAASDAASRAGIDATPTMTLVDRPSGKSIMLAGAINGDALLSAMDLLTTASSADVLPPSTASASRQSANKSPHTR